MAAVARIQASQKAHAASQTPMFKRTAHAKDRNIMISYDIICVYIYIYVFIYIYINTMHVYLVTENTKHPSYFGAPVSASVTTPGRVNMVLKAPPNKMT